MSVFISARVRASLLAIDGEIGLELDSLILCLPGREPSPDSE